ncbi:MAG TPA: glycosyl hydrolase [Rhizomicrobium sp.]
MRRLRTALHIGVAAAAVTVGFAAFAGGDRAVAGRAGPSDPLVRGFQAPPQSARPRVWWHWMNGNVSKDGIRKDLEWMKRVGIGGINAIDASLATPQVVDKRLIYMTPEWRDAFRYAAGLADSKGLEMSIDSSPGWSETGAPWVAPQDAMKKAVWSATTIEGGKPFHGVLPQPPSTTGPIQNAPMQWGVLDPKPKSASLSFYRDTVVLAYREPVAASAVATASSDAGALDPAALTDGDLTDGPVLMPAAGGRQVQIRLAYAKPTQVQAISLSASADGAFGAAVVLESSSDGKTWQHVADIPATKVPLHTVTFAPVTTRYFRATFSPAPSPIPPGIFTNFAPGAAARSLLAMVSPAAAALRFHIHELVLHGDARVNEAEMKADYGIVSDYYAIATTTAAPDTAVAASDVVVLTDRMKPDGTLDWTAPPGRWTVLRMGYSLLGTENHPAPAEATGLEVDKLNREHVQAYMQGYFDLYKQVTGPELFGAHGVTALTVDSTEVGMQNWTETILADFKALRGYDATPWLPVLTGIVIQSPEASDKFLWDFRRTINQLVARNHYGEIATLAKAQGLTNYAEALEDHRPTFGDDMEMRQYASVPMAAMWTYGRRRESFPTYVADIRGAASVAHIYGQNIVAAESLTSAVQPWAYAPRQLKPIVDLEFALGVNRIVVHTSVHQPIDKPPGLSLFIFGQFFNRLENWADDAQPWVSYLSRCSYLLQQGRYAADIAYFYGEEAPITGLFGEKDIDVPAGHGFDFVNSSVLLDQASVDGHDLATRSGMHYRVLYLGGSSRYMTLPVLRRIRDLVAQGVTLAGARPLGSPSLSDDPVQFEAAADDLFGGAPDHAYGKGRVISGVSLGAALASLNLPPDFQYSKPETDAELLDIHRKLDRGDLYFVANRLDRPERVTATFRVTGYAPELWNAVTGQVTPAPYRIVDGRTEIPLALGGYGSTFVVFRHPTSALVRKDDAPAAAPAATLTGPWSIAFQPDRGAPARIVQKDLQSWSDSAEPGVRYFSGSAVYTKRFTLPAAAKGRLTLDLGDLHEVAEVSLNGHPLGILWNPPFTMDITGAVRSGENVLQVKVANLWVNRLIGDMQPGVTQKYTFTTIPTYEPDAPLRSSGLLGPVRILKSSP